MDDWLTTLWMTDFTHLSP